MNNILKNLITNNLKLNKKRTIVSIIGIVLSVALITAVSSMYMSGLKSLIKYVKSTRGNFHVIIKNVKGDNIASIQNNRIVNKVNVAKGLGYAKVDSKNDHKPYIFIEALAKDSYNDFSIKLLDGALPQNDNQIVIPKHLETNGKVKYQIGDKITLDLSKRLDLEDGNKELGQDTPMSDSEKLEKIQTKEYTIVGIIDRPVNNVESITAPGYTAFTILDGQKQSDKYDLYISAKKEKIKDIYTFIDGIIDVDSDLLYKTCNQDTLNKADEERFNTQMSKAKYKVNMDCRLINLEINPIEAVGVDKLSSVLAVVISIIVFTSVFVIKNSFDISVTEKIRQYGMLRSVGATKKQIRSMVFKEANILGTIATPIGVLLGLLATYILVIVSNYLISTQLIEGFSLEFSISIIAIVVSIILGVITIYLSAISSARNASKVSPIDSIRSSADIKKDKKEIKTSSWIAKLFGVGGVISHKNLQRSKKKYITTTISITVSVIVFIALSSFAKLMFGETDKIFEGFKYNISLSLRSTDKETYNELVEIGKFDKIEDSSIVRSDYIDISTKYLSKEYLQYTNINKSEPYIIRVTSIGNEQFGKYLKSLNINKDTLKDKAILIDNINFTETKENGEKTTKNIRMFNLNENDTAEVKIMDNNTTFDITIGKVTIEMPFGLEGAEAGILIINDEYFDKIITAPKYMDLYIYSNNSEEVTKQIENHLKNEELYYLFDRTRQVNEMNNFALLASIFLYGFVTVISLIGITNVFNTITTNMQLRRREFATLKSIGMTKKEFNRMIGLESIFMGIKSLIIGIPIGVVLSLIMQHFIIDGKDIPYDIPILPICISIFVVFVLILTIMKYSINEINKQNTIETIRNENI